MRVNIDEITEQPGLERTWDLAQEWVDAVVSINKAGYRAKGPAHWEIHLEKVDRHILISGRVGMELTCACGRCLTTMNLRVPLDFKLTLVPADEYAQHEQQRHAHGEWRDRGEAHLTGSFDAQGADEETYTGKVIDLEPILREQVLLSLLNYPVCREECRGLCTVCGANLNDRECGCDRHVPDPRWAGLKNVKLQ